MTINRKGLEIAVNFIVILILALVVLIAFILYFNRGVSKFEEGTKPFLDIAASNAVKESCKLSCKLEDMATYCCKKFEVDKKEVFCLDERLDLDCNLDCSSYTC